MSPKRQADPRNHLRRQQVAQAAARLLASGEQVDIDQARRKAATRLGIRDEAALPDAARIREALAGLPERERLVLELRFGFVEGKEGASLEQIGKQLGLTRERIRQLESTALDRLESVLKTESLPSRDKLAGVA